MSEIKRDAVFYETSQGGVTFSGGEPLAQAEFLHHLLGSCKAAGIHTALDTCGYAPWETLDSLRHDVDLFLYDLRIMDTMKHQETTGGSLDLILEKFIGRADFQLTFSGFEFQNICFKWQGFHLYYRGTRLNPGTGRNQDFRYKPFCLGIKLGLIRNPDNTFGTGFMGHGHKQ